MGKTACCEKNGLKKGPWTVEEDHKLIDYITKRGAGRWRMLPKIAGLKRCGKSCRLRWTNYLRPDIKRGKFSFEEEETIIQLHSILGNKWSTMAARLPGRTDNEIKNYWNTHIRKKLLRMGIDPVTHTARRDLLEFSSILSSSLFNNNNPSHDEVFNNIPSSNHSLGIQPTMNPNFLSLAAALLSSQHNKNPEFVPLNLQNNQLCNHPQFQNHFQTTNIQACATSSASGTAPFLNDAQLMQANNNNTMEPFSQSQVNFGYQNDLPNLWQNPINMTETFVMPRPIPKYDYSNYSNTDEYIVDPLSINPPMVQSKNSSSSTICTVNGSCITTEDEKDSYCSNILMLDGFM